MVSFHSIANQFSYYGSQNNSRQVWALNHFVLPDSVEELAQSAEGEAD